MSRDWLELGRIASERLSGAIEHGSTMAARAALAAELGTTRQTLRNYAEYYDFVTTVAGSNSAAATALAQLGPNAVAEYLRWARLDRDAALRHAIEAVAREISGRAAAAEARAARSRLAPIRMASGPADAASWPTAAIHRALQRAGFGLLDSSGLDEGTTDLALAIAAGVRQVLAWPEDDALLLENGARHPSRAHFFEMRGVAARARWDVVGLIEVAPSRIEDMPARVAKATFAKAVMAASLYPLVLILLPGTEAARRFESALPPLPEHGLDADPRALGEGSAVLSSSLGAVVWTGAPLTARRHEREH